MILVRRTNIPNGAYVCKVSVTAYIIVKLNSNEFCVHIVMCYLQYELL